MRFLVLSLANLLQLFLALAVMVDPAPPAKLRIVTGLPPQASLNVPYKFVMKARGGTKPYAWSVISGSLPPGLKLHTIDNRGVIEGVPKQVGQWLAVVQVKDSAGQFDIDEIGDLRHFDRTRSREPEILPAAAFDFIVCSDRLDGCWGPCATPSSDASSRKRK